MNYSLRNTSVKCVKVKKGKYIEIKLIRRNTEIT